MEYELSHCPPLSITRPCGPCGKDVEVAVWPTGTVEACPHLRPRLLEAVRRQPQPYELWGGQPGYAVVPLGAALFMRGGGYRYAAPFDGGRTTHVLGKGDGVYVAVALDENEWLWLTSPSHYPCGEDEAPPALGLEGLAARILIGKEGDPVTEPLVIFEPLVVGGGEEE